MIVTCKSILELPHLEKMKLVAGQGSLNNVISWVHVVELPEVSDWVKGGELLFITGVGIKDNRKALLKLVKDISDRKLSGLVINVGPYIKETPKEVIDLANNLDFPIFELPFEVKLIDITQIICRAIFENKLQKESMDSFMREIIFGDINITDEIINRATLYGYSSNKVYVPLVLDIDNFSMYLKRKNIKNDQLIVNIKMQIQEIVEQIIHNHNKKCLYAIQGDAFFIMISVGKNHNKTDGTFMEDINSIAENIREIVSTKINSLTVSIGIGEICSDLKDFKKVIFKAQKALEISKRCGKKNCITKYKDLGIYRLFFQMSVHNEMQSLYNETLLKLKDYDDKNSTNLLETLIVYIEQNRNLGKTAETLYVHRNTMKYRIKRIEEILECNLKEDKIAFNIMLCIEVGKFLNII
jgi:PucR family transcriptional regulator, purine catabolism regulatory protein